MDSVNYGYAPKVQTYSVLVEKNVQVGRFVCNFCCIPHNDEKYYNNYKDVVYGIWKFIVT